MRTGLLLKLLLIIFTSIAFYSCDLVSKTAFFPKNDPIIPDDKLPGYVKHIQIKTEDDLLINALYFSGNKKQQKLAVYFHGNAENIYIIKDQGENIFRMGTDILLVSYRGYAKSQGKPSEKGIYIDGKSALNYAINVLGYNQKNIIIIGRSIGTTVAVDISQNQELAGVILLSPLSSGIDFIRSKHLSGFKYLTGNIFDSIGKINNLKCPLLVIHGDRDRVISYDLGLKLYNAYKGEKEFIQVKTGGHNDLFIVNPELYWSSIEKFIKIK